jgi:hypothetical protein
MATATNIFWMLSGDFRIPGYECEIEINDLNH